MVSLFLPLDFAISGSVNLRCGLGAGVISGLHCPHSVLRDQALRVGTCVVTGLPALWELGQRGGRGPFLGVLHAIDMASQSFID